MYIYIMDRETALDVDRKNENSYFSQDIILSSKVFNNMNAITINIFLHVLLLF